MVRKWSTMQRMRSVLFSWTCSSSCHTLLYNSIIHGNLLADISCYKHCWYSLIHSGANCFPSENYCIWQSPLQRDGLQIKLGTWTSTKIDEFWCQFLYMTSLSKETPFSGSSRFRCWLLKFLQSFGRSQKSFGRAADGPGCSHTRAMKDVVKAKAKEKVFSNV